MRFVARAALSFAEFDFERIAQHLHAARDALFIESSKAEAQGVRLRLLRVEIPARDEKDAAFADVNQKFACIETGRQRDPD